MTLPSEIARQEHRVSNGSGAPLATDHKDANGSTGSSLWLDALAPALRERLAAVLDAYLMDVENGSACTPAELLRQHADLATPLQHALDGLNLVSHIAASFPLRPRGCAFPELGDYQILREVGRGGMGIVYEARQQSLGRTVALKVLPFAAVLEPNQVSRFQNEAQAAAQLHHPHIVPVYAVGCERGVHYYSMQFIDGQSLDMALGDQRHEGEPGQGGEQRQLPPSAAIAANGESAEPKEAAGTVRCGPSTLHSIHTKNHVRGAVELILQAADALHYAHECGVIHRDIKPSNLLLDRRGKLWVTDFGLARCRNQSQLTTQGQVCGTIRYMSPEQAAGRSAWIDPRTDVYALGVTLFELLTLRTPFDAEDREGLIRQIAEEEPPLPRKLNRAVPADLENIVLKALAKSRDDRYGTADEFAADMRRFLGGQPTLARRPTWRDRLWKWTARRSKMVAASALAMLLAIGMLSGALFWFAQLNYATEKALHEAELHLDVARATVDDFSAQLSEELALIPGTETVRLAALERAQSFYRQFSEYAGNDARWLRDAAMAKAKQGAVLEKLQRMDEAETAYRQAHSHFVDLLAHSPRDRELRTETAYCSQQLAMLLIRTHRPAEGLRWLSSAEVDLKRSISELPGSRELRADLLRLQADAGTALHNLGSEQNDMAQFADARSVLQQALAIRRELHRQDPLDAVRRSELAATLNNMGTAWLDERPEESTRCFAEARQLIATQLPGDYKLRSELAIAINNQGIAAERLGLWESAATFFQEAIEQQELAVQQSGQQQQFKELLEQHRANHVRVRQRGNSNSVVLESSATT